MSGVAGSHYSMALTCRQTYQETLGLVFTYNALEFHIHTSPHSALQMFTKFIHTQPLRTHPFMRKITILGTDVSLPALGDILTGQQHSDVHVFCAANPQARVILRLNRPLYDPPEACLTQTLMLTAWRAALRNKDISSFIFPGLTKEMVDFYTRTMRERMLKLAPKEMVLDDFRATPTAEFWAVETAETRELWAQG